MHRNFYAICPHTAPARIRCRPAWRRPAPHARVAPRLSGPLMRQQQIARTDGCVHFFGTQTEAHHQIIQGRRSAGSLLPTHADEDARAPRRLLWRAGCPPPPYQNIGLPMYEKHRQECLCYIFSRGWRDPTGYEVAGEDARAPRRLLWRAGCPPPLLKHRVANARETQTGMSVLHF